MTKFYQQLQTDQESNDTYHANLQQLTQIDLTKLRNILADHPMSWTNWFWQVSKC